MDIFKAMEKIPVQVVNKDPKEWYLALNMWLYSFSLRGITGRDMPNISEKYVEGEKYKLPYYPDYMTNKEYSSLGGKSYLQMKRGKTKHAFVNIGHEKNGFLHYHDLGPQLLSLLKFVKFVNSSWDTI